MHNVDLTGQRDEIAIVGMAGRFPGAKNVHELWRNLCEGVESVTFFTVEEMTASGVDPELSSHPMYVNASGFLEGADSFDAPFFGYSPREAELMDPQHRIFLECAWTAIEHAGYDPEDYDGSIGIFGGVGQNTYLLHNVAVYLDLIHSGAAHMAELCSDKDFSVTRVSYKLNLKGPSLNVQTACSTSAVAVHLACQSLLDGECDMALAGGAQVRVPLKAGYIYVEGAILSPDGHCRAFDENAHGTILGSGAGIIVLKRLVDAVRDGDTIHAVVKGTAINNDGAARAGYTAPSVEGQAAVIEEALVMADVDADTIGYVETHGTGTRLGDPIEIAALTRAFRKYTDRVGFCPIGSVKTNIGHLEPAAGVAGIIKTVLALQHKLIPPSPNFVRPNPQIDFANSPFYVNTKLSEWRASSTPRRAGVSSFGFGGTNAHIILEEAPNVQPSGESRPYQMLLLSTPSESSLERATSNIAEHLRMNPDLNLADVAYTLQVGRRAFGWRRILVCQNLDEAVAALTSSATGFGPKVLTGSQPVQEQSMAFLFTGQGSQYVNMAQELYQVEPTFREQADLCCDLLQPHLGLDLRSVLYPGEGTDLEAAAEQLKQTAIAQPALFMIQYALAQLWRQWGIEPQVMVGHSIGEYTAACLAGVFSLEDALSLVVVRGRLMQELPGGSMLATFLSEREIEPFLLDETLSLAAINGPSLCVVSGENGAIDDLERQLSARNVDCRRLHTSHAFHSKMMDPILDTFTEQVEQVGLHPPQIPFVSNVTGAWITSNEATTPSYWAKHLRQTVRFSDCVQELLREPNRVLLEVGPGRTLTTLARQHIDRRENRILLSSIRHPKEQGSDIAFILNTLGRLWLAGVQPDWPGFYGNERRHRLPLPTYPFERVRHWIEPVQRPQGIRAYQAGLAKMGDDSQRLSGRESRIASLAPKQPELQGEPRAANGKMDGGALSASDQTRPGFEETFVPPRTPVEQRMADIWAQVLGLERVSVHDDFFELGGHSLLAVRLFAEMEKATGKKLALSTIFQAPTVEQLASIIGQAEYTLPSLVPIQPQGSKLPFFCVHPSCGDVSGFAVWTGHLGRDQPFYGLRARGWDGVQETSIQIEAMAADYIREVRTVQPEGPYLLGGYGFGGVVAFEMAQQLHAKGYTIALLAVLYQEAPNSSYRRITWRPSFVVDFLGNLPYWLSDFMRSRPTEVLQLILEKAGVPIGARMRFDEHVRLHAKRIEAHEQAWQNYVPQVYPGRVTLFRTRRLSLICSFDPEMGWGEFAAGGVDVRVIPGSNVSILEEPDAQVLAEELRACLDEAGRMLENDSS